jgi:glycosyltransferase involved in cell wall biosynthesis
MAATAFVGREATPGLVRQLQTAMRVVRLPSSARRPDRWAIGELVRLPIAGRRAGIDLLHSLANFAPASGPFRRVITLHDLQYRAVPELLTPARRLGTTVLLETAVRRADRIIAVSRSSGDEITETLGIAPARIDVIPNGVRLPDGAGRPAAGALRAGFGLGDRPVVLTVATDLPHKNLDRLLEALALIPADQRPVLVLAGPRTDGHRLRERAVAAGVSGDVRPLGFVTATELDGLYALATASVLPSLYEGFGLPVLESLARGVPVACSDIGPLHEVAGDAALRFDPRRVEDIAAAIQRLLDDPPLRQRLAAAGPGRAAAFTWRRAAEATLATYRRALASDD